MAMINPLMIAALAALTVAVAVYLLTVYMPIGRSAASKRLERSLSAPDLTAAKAVEYEFDTREFRAALALRRLHIPAKPGEEVKTLNTIRVVLAALGAGAAFLFGLPIVLVVAVPAVLWFAVDLLANMQVAAARRAIESSIAAVFSDVAGMATLSADAGSILNQAAKNLATSGDTLLVPEIVRVANEVQTKGREALVEAEARVQRISPSLSLLFFIVRRLQDTGGTQFGNAFELASENLGAILSVRQKIQAKADGARGTIRIIVGVFAFILFQMLLNAQMREAYTSPVAQLILAGAIGMMAFGYWFINGQIEEVM